MKTHVSILSGEHLIVELMPGDFEIQLLPNDRLNLDLPSDMDPVIGFKPVRFIRPDFSHNEASTSNTQSSTIDCDN